MSNLSATLNYNLPSFVVATKKQLSKYPVKNGQVIFCKDKQQIYYDWNDTRKAYHDVFIVEKDEELIGENVSLVEGKFYFSMESHDLWMVANQSLVKMVSASDGRINFISKGSDLPTDGKENTLYVKEDQLYRYDRDEAGFRKLAQLKWGSF